MRLRRSNDLFFVLMVTLRLLFLFLLTSTLIIFTLNEPIVVARLLHELLTFVLTGAIESQSVLDHLLLIGTFPQLVILRRYVVVLLSNLVLKVVDFVTLHFLRLFVEVVMDETLLHCGTILLTSSLLSCSAFLLHLIGVDIRWHDP